jgi:hypothetical protein
MSIEKFLMLLASVLAVLIAFLVIFAAFSGVLNAAVVTAFAGFLVPALGGIVGGLVLRSGGDKGSK